MEIADFHKRYAVAVIPDCTGCYGCRDNIRRCFGCRGGSSIRVFRPSWRSASKRHELRASAAGRAGPFAGRVDRVPARYADGGEEQTSDAAALGEFSEWRSQQPEPLSKALLEAWRGALLARGLAVSSINQRLSAVRWLFRQAAERGALPLEEAARLASVKNVKQAGQRLGTWLSPKQKPGNCSTCPNPHTTIGKWDRAILALLIACGLRRDELVRLELLHLQLREERWVLLDLRGKGRRVRTVPVPLWVKQLLDPGWKRPGSRTGRCFARCAKVERSAGKGNRSATI